MINDGTVEKIGELLNRNPRGLLLSRDELSGWFWALEKPGREGDREFYLEGWNGSGGFTYDRIGRGTLHIPALCLSIFGTIQPGKLKAYIDAALRGGAGDDGLLQRMQLAVWPEISKDWVNIDRAPDRSARNQAFRIFEELDQITPKEIGAQTQGEEIPSLRFAPEAQAIFGAFLEKLERRLRSGTLVDAPAFESYLSKYRSLMPSLALIFHLMKRVDGSSGTAVSATAARLAERWCGFLEAHARKIYAPELNQELATARALFDKIRDGSITDEQRRLAAILLASGCIA